MASSSAATPIMVSVTLPLALYSCITASVAVGSVGAASEATSILKFDISHFILPLKNGI
jgi:hypothetical protein